MHPDNIVSLDISAVEKPNKDIVDYLKSNNIKLKNNKAHIQFVPPSN